MKRWLTVIVLIACIAGWFAFAAPALAATADERAVQKILQHYQSPLPWWTITSFKKSHPDFDIAGYLTVAFCESKYGTLGKSATFCNPGNIIAPDRDSWELWRVWWTWQTGTFVSANRLFGAYPDQYTGQRALIRLLYDHPNGYNDLLKRHQWYDFATKYWGPRDSDPIAFDTYLANLVACHARVVRQGSGYGAVW